MIGTRTCTTTAPMEAPRGTVLVQHLLDMKTGNFLAVQCLRNGSGLAARSGASGGVPGTAQEESQQRRSAVPFHATVQRPESVDLSGTPIRHRPVVGWRWPFHVPSASRAWNDPLLSAPNELFIHGRTSPDLPVVCPVARLSRAILHKPKKRKCNSCPRSWVSTTSRTSSIHWIPLA